VTFDAHRPLIYALAALISSACSGGGSSGSAAPAFGLEQRPPAAALSFPAQLSQPGPLNAIRAFPNLSFDRPVLVTPIPDGSSRLAVLEQVGRIRVFADQDSVTSAALFLDLSAQVLDAGEQGLLGLAFDPDYAQSGRFYVYYSATNPRRSVLSSFQVQSNNPNAADPTSEQVLLEISQPFSNHNGGMLAFGPDGMLYVSSGDGGSAGDPGNRAQDLTSLLGKLLRIDPRNGSSYDIPPDNPFVSAGGGARGEVWAYGLRNPWRFSFDRLTGELWLGDVGQNAVEEIDIVARGDNLGWRIFEGDRSFSNPFNLGQSSFKEPILSYDHSQGQSVTGGVVYRGQILTSIRGAYVYGDFISGRVWALVHQNGALISSTEVSSVQNVSAFGEDSQGELLCCSYGGQLLRFQEAGRRPPAPTGLPQRLSDTGLFSDTASLTPAKGLIEYDVNSELWSDGAHKRRWLALPGQAQVEFEATGAWSFPRDTVIVKHFELELQVGQPSSRRRVETRVLRLGPVGWEGLSYRWNASQTDADLLPGAATDDFVVTDPVSPGGTRVQRWSYPSRSDCSSCHTQAAGVILGLRTRQLNGDFDYPATVDNQLRSFDHIGLFDQPIGAISQYGAFVDPADASLDLAARARSYLHVNCASCHQPGGPAPGSIDLRFDTALAQAGLVGVRPTGGDLGLPDAFRIKAQERGSSVLFERVRRLDTTRMPPLGSNLVDADAVELIGRWIDAGPP
jgi:uncharacterized repeat protein (TIGR03806 family)